MSMTERESGLEVLVTGATGNQGGAVTRELLNRSHSVRALTRRPNSPAAERLEEMGANVVVGNFEEPDTLMDAVEGTEAVFAMGTPFEKGMEAETRQATNLVDAVEAVGTDHLVYSSVASADEDTGIPHFESKVPVEERVRRADVPSTIVAPVFFMENLISPWLAPSLREGELALGLPTDDPLQVVDLPDLAAVTADVLERRVEFVDQRIEVACDEVTPEQMAEAITEASGQAIEAVEVPIDAMMEENEDFALMFEWFQEEGYAVDLDQLGSTFPKAPFNSFETWAHQVDWDAALAE